MIADRSPRELEQADISDWIWSSGMSLSSKSPSATSVVPEDTGLDLAGDGSVDSGSMAPKWPKLRDLRNRLSGVRRDCNDTGRRLMTVEIRLPLADDLNPNLFNGISATLDADAMDIAAIQTSGAVWKSKQRAQDERPNLLAVGSH